MYSLPIFSLDWLLLFVFFFAGCGCCSVCNIAFCIRHKTKDNLCAPRQYFIFFRFCCCWWLRCLMLCDSRGQRWRAETTMAYFIYIFIRMIRDTRRWYWTAATVARWIEKMDLLAKDENSNNAASHHIELNFDAIRPVLWPYAFLVSVAAASHHRATWAQTHTHTQHTAGESLRYIFFIQLRL